MGFDVSEQVQALNTKLEAFMQEHVYPQGQCADLMLGSAMWGRVGVPRSLSRS